MSLITCCPSCGTKFRMVADQLRISDGWVRCGRCQMVFDATQALQTLAAAASAPAAPAPVQESATPDEVVAKGMPDPVDQLQPPPQASGYELPVPPELEEDAWLEVPLEEGERSTIASRVAAAQASTEPAWDAEEAVQQQVLPAQPSAAEAVVEVSSEVAPEIASQIPVQPQPLSSEAVSAPQADPAHEPEVETQPASQEVVPQAAVPLQQGEPASQDALPEEVLPSFVRQAQRKAWWRRPAVRRSMGGLVVLLPVVLALQVAVHERNRLVAWKPQWKPIFERICAVGHCNLEPPQSIASVVLTGSALRQDARPHHYQLDLSMQNQDGLIVATPAVELTLTDVQDQVLVRKVLTPAEIGAPLELGPRGEWSGTLPLVTQGLNLPVSGYRVTAFYP